MEEVFNSFKIAKVTQGKVSNFIDCLLYDTSNIKKAIKTLGKFKNPEDAYYIFLMEYVHQIELLERENKLEKRGNFYYIEGIGNITISLQDYEIYKSTKALREFTGETEISKVDIFMNALKETLIEGYRLSDNKSRLFIPKKYTPEVLQLAYKYFNEVHILPREGDEEDVIKFYKDSRLTYKFEKFAEFMNELGILTRLSRHYSENKITIEVFPSVEDSLLDFESSEKIGGYLIDTKYNRDFIENVVKRHFKPIKIYNSERNWFVDNYGLNILPVLNYKFSYKF